MKKPNAFIMIGRSGCGKGTQVELLIKYLGDHDKESKTIEIESGSILRDYAKGDSFPQKRCKEIMGSGKLIPEFLMIGLWANKILLEVNGSQNIVCDGTPRRLHEAMVLNSVFDFYGFDKPAVIYVDVSREWSKQRLLARKRADDTEKDIENRLDWFETDVFPTLNYFKDNLAYNFVRVNGEQSIEEVHQEIMDKLGYK